MGAESATIRVLLVDEKREDYQSVVDLLSEGATRQFTVKWVQEYDVACDALRQGESDICLLDGRFASANDWKFTRETSAQLCTIPVIFLLDDESLAAHALKAPLKPADYLLKTEMTTALLERSILFSIEHQEVYRALQKADAELAVLAQRCPEEHLRTISILQDKEIFLRSTLDALPHNVAVLDAEGYILCTNQSWNAFAQANGLEDYPFEGVNYLAVCDNAKGEWSEEAPMAAAEIRDIISGLKTEYELEYPCHSPEVQRWFFMRVSGFRQDSQIRVVVSHSDITTRKQAQQLLESQQARIEAVLDNLPAGVALFEERTDQVFTSAIVNSMAEKILDRPVPVETAKYQLAKYFHACCAGTDEYYPAEQMPLIRAMAGESTYIDDMEIKRRDGSRVRIEVTGAPVFDPTKASASAVVVFRDITERKQGEEDLRKSEQKFRELAENIREIFWIRTQHELVYINPVYEEIWGSTCDSAYEDPLSFLKLVHPEDRERIKQIYQTDFDRKERLDFEYRIIRPDGGVRWIWSRCSPIVRGGKVVRVVGSAEDITARKEAEEFLRIERDLAVGIESSSNLLDAMQLVLEAALRINPMDCGGIYLLENENRFLRLVCSYGLSGSFVEQVSGYDIDTPQGRFVMQGEPGFWIKPWGILDTGDLLTREGLLTLAAIPVKSEGKIVAVLNLGSRIKSEISTNARHLMETIAAHVGRVIARVQLIDSLRIQGERLQEVNTALGVLLEQRQNDRRGFEVSLLDNVEHLILPYIEKLKKTGISDTQKIYLDILESHVEEITKPFIHKISSEFRGLTPTEIRIADLIRQGKTSKEIANLLGSTERAIIFHRQSIRRKLGLLQKKANLQSYLASLLK